MGNRYFSKVQFGKETVRGTAVAADTILLCDKLSVKTDRKPVYPSENIGIRAPAMRSEIYQYLYTNTLVTPHGYFQMLPALFGCGLKGGVVPSEVTAGQRDYLWSFTPNLAFGVSNAQDSMTIELGDDTQAFEAEFCMYERIRISWQVSQGMDASPVNIERDFFGRQLTPTTFTGGLVLPSIEPMNGKLSRLYADNAWANVGNTELENILRGADIEILTGLYPKFSGSGYKYFDGFGEDVMEVTAKLTLEGGSDADAIFDAHLANTFQVIRLEINGGQIGTGTNHNLSIDLGGTWEEVTPLGGEDRGDNLTDAVLRSYYDPTGQKQFQVNVTTDVDSY